jgi:hypothetical protein
MTTGHVLHASLDLLDRQLRDRHGVLCGKVDDLELSRSPDTGAVYVTAIVTGPGALMRRLGRRRLGGWLERAHAALGGGARDDDSRVPMGMVSSLGATIDLALDAAEVATHSGERWARDHVISHIPGSRHDADE